MAVEIQERPAALQHILAEIESLTPQSLYQLRQVLDAKLQALTTVPPKVSRISGTYTPKDRAQEDEWVRLHREEYAGQWVALDGGRLLAHGFNLKEVVEIAKQSSVPDPLYVQVEPENALPWAGF